MAAAAPNSLERPQSRRGAVRPPSPPARRFRVLLVASLLVCDVAALGLAYLLAYKIHGAMVDRPTRIAPPEAYFLTLLSLAGCVLLALALYHLYLPRRGTSLVDQLGSLMLAIVVGNVAALAMWAITRRGLDVPREILGYGLVLSIVLVAALRSIIDLFLRAARRHGHDIERVLIIGASEEGRSVAHKIAAYPDLGYAVVGFVDERAGSRAAAREEGPPVLGTLADLPELLERWQVTRVLITDRPPRHILNVIIGVCDRARVDVVVVPDWFDLVVQEVDASELGGMPLLRVRDVGLRGWNLRIKRSMDILLSAVLLVLLAPVMLAVAALVKLSSPGPVFYVQERVGLDGRRFPCVKFRSMRVDAEAETGPVWARPDDDRTTGVGRVLRRFSIDELPQLINVLLGDMSLVGPRPERPVFVEEFSRLIPRYDQRHQEKAGMTGWAQVNGLRGQAPIAERTRYDLFYVERWSPAFDLKILLKTIGAVIRGRDAY